LLGLHHLPFTVLLIAAAVVAFRTLYRKACARDIQET
jgi:hypothetical protein